MKSLTKYCKYCQEDVLKDDIGHWYFRKDGEKACRRKRYDQDKIYRENNREICREKVRKWKRSNREHGRKYQDIIGKGAKAKFNVLKTQAKKRNIEVEIKLDDYVTIVEGNECFYCSNTLPLRGHGIDRLDSYLGYSVDNCVPCCTDCNCGKRKMSYSEFLIWITKVYQKMILETGG